MATLAAPAIAVPTDAFVGLPHWEIAVRPAHYVAARIATQPELGRLVADSTVNWRAWGYPLTVEDQRWNQGSASISLQATGPGGRRERLRFFQSGLFEHQFTFVEEAYRDDLATHVLPHVRVPTAFCPSGFVSYEETLRILTEVFEFAARLCESGQFGETVVIRVNMTNVRNRLLVTSDWRHRRWTSFCPARQETLDYDSGVLTAVGLIAARRELAIDAAISFYEQFGWTGYSRQLLRADQERLVDRQFA